MGSLAFAANFATSWAMWTSPKDETSQAGGKLLDPPTTRMGRVLASSVAVYAKPEHGAKRLAYWERDEAFMITGEVRSQGLNATTIFGMRPKTGMFFRPGSNLCSNIPRNPPTTTWASGEPGEKSANRSPRRGLPPMRQQPKSTATILALPATGAYGDDYIQSNWRVGTPIIIY